jgi:predicted RNA-binding Zn-ribbon protein involved in translation (DUF1610 family)
MASFSFGVNRRVECGACWEDVEEQGSITTLCGELYCAFCLRAWFFDVVRAVDFTDFPPKCCVEHRDALFPLNPDGPMEIILAEDVASILGRDLVDAYRAKYEEWKTPDKTYCSGCGKFVPERHTASDAARCPVCGHETCARCKADKHPGDWYVTYTHACSYLKLLGFWEKGLPSIAECKKLTDDF